jgi:uncharacterized protein
MDKKRDNQKSMEAVLDKNRKKIDGIMEIKVDYLKNRITMEEAKLKLRNQVEFVTPEEFALCEQQLSKYGISDDVITKRIDEIVEIFDGILQSKEISVPDGHPIHTYLLEVEEIRKLVDKMQQQLEQKFIKNQWLELYDQLEGVHIHFARKQNQLFPRFENKGFDKPSKVMWTLENKIRDSIKFAKEALEKDQQEVFVILQKEVNVLLEDMMDKEVEVLYPTALEMISEEEFVEMYKGDQEIGYGFGIKPKDFSGTSNKRDKVTDGDEKPDSISFMEDFMNLLEKHGLSTSSKTTDQVLDVSRGKLTLEQINLIFKHLPVDLSFVDENDLVKFYSDTKHRIFPRSPGVIGRKVENCHPRESLDTVMKIVKAFKSGDRDQAEFWLQIEDQFIYILFVAVRDENKNFKGVLEIMQDVTRIRSLTGSQRLLSWETEENEGVESALGEDRKKEKAPEDEGYIDNPPEKGTLVLRKDTLIKDLIKEYPFIKEELLSLSPKFQKLKNPILFNTMSSVATLEMIASRGNLEVEELIAALVKRIEKER